MSSLFVSGRHDGNERGGRGEQRPQHQQQRLTGEGQLDHRAHQLQVPPTINPPTQEKLALFFSLTFLRYTRPNFHL